MEIKELTGRHIYEGMINGGKMVILAQNKLNNINVFPVADGDTGSNLASTMYSIIEKTKFSDSVGETMRSIADSALLGARGNSGTIFAQFLNGLSLGIGEKHKITTDEFADSVKIAVTFSYDAVNEPVEGTMLTVIKEWAEHIHFIKDKADNFVKLLSESFTKAVESLKQTPEKLQVLYDAGVVDAGAEGFVVFLEGFTNYITNPNKILKDILNTEKEENITLVKSFNHEVKKEIKYRYCTESLIRTNFIDKNLLKSELEKFGDSLILAGNNGLIKTHIHTNTPEKVFEILSSIGTINEIKVDDMKKQNEMLNKRISKVAIVTDSSADIPQDLIDRYQINVVPLNIYFGDSLFLDKITIKPEQFYNKIEKDNSFPKSSQPNEKVFFNLFSYLSNYYESIIAIHLSEKFSGTFNSSLKASKKIKNVKIDVINSKNLSASLGLIVLNAARTAADGVSHEEIIQRINTSINNTLNLVSVKTLDYMVRGGRVSRAGGKIAKFLNLKPIVSVDNNGNSKLYGNSFGEKSNWKKIGKMIELFIKNKKIKNYCIVHANNHDEAIEFSRKMEKIIGIKPEYIMEISSVIAMNAGKGALSIAVMTE